MAALPANLVYEGFWTDHSRGAVLGATITLSSSRANIVLVVLTLIIAYAGPHLWDLVAFLNFLSKSTDEERDGIHHQLQLLLRNASSPSTYAWECLKIALYWRVDVRRRCSRLIYTSLLALLCSVGFIVAGVLSAEILSSGSISVLVQPLYCGYRPDNLTSQVGETADALFSYDSYMAALSWSFTKRCYHMDSAKDPACNVYTHQIINFTTLYDRCPFADTCLLKEHTALTMDTGLVNSNDVFGVNTKADNTINFRKRSTCGVLDSDRYLSKMPSSKAYGDSGVTDSLPNETVWTWSFGSRGLAGNITFVASSHYCNAVSDFEIRAWSATPPPSGTSDPPEWIRIPPFDRNDSDVLLLLVQTNSVAFQHPVDDPLFSAHTAQSDLASTGLATFYSGDRCGRVLGCIEKYQFCIPQGNCTSLGPSRQALEAARQFSMNEIQSATIRRFADQISPYFMISSMGVAGLPDPPALQIVDSLGGATVMLVPNNQWEIETKSMFSLSLARIQKGIADVATGPLGTGKDEQFHKYFQAPVDSAGLELCRNQKMKAPNGFSNINIFGLGLISGLCGLIVLANLLVTPSMKLIARHSRPMSVGMRHWIADGMLQVQRRAFERREYNDWRNRKRDVPVTGSLATFPGLAVDECGGNVRAPKIRAIITSSALASNDEDIESSSAQGRRVDGANADRVDDTKAPILGEV